ncbi:MAG: DNA-directed RNA polymerase subunit L [Candidatus Altiarchaeota archaeon]|nr:DNA-directed RNA polymerase subunit L [Candidatus Altiarchaeota archaeon]
MEVKMLSKKDNEWVVELTSEDHTMANLLRELSWENGGEAAYKLEHPLLGKPQLKVMAKSPKKVLEASSKQMIKMSNDFEKAFK